MRSHSPIAGSLYPRLTVFFSKLFGRKNREAIPTLQYVAEKEFRGIGVNAKDLGHTGNLQIDEFGYQMLSIKRDRVVITFPDGNTICTPTDYLQKIILRGFNYEPATSK